MNKTLSKRLSWLLKHGATETGLHMDEAGWAQIDDVLAALDIPRSELELVVRDNDKKRLRIDGDRIRATQGHSSRGTPVTIAALETSWERVTDLARAWHGTGLDALEDIARDGLQPMGRTHVHLAASVDAKVGKRSNVAVGLAIDVRALGERGIPLFRSENGVLLAREVPRSCIVDLICMTRRAKRSEDELRALFALR